MTTTVYPYYTYNDYQWPRPHTKCPNCGYCSCCGKADNPGKATGEVDPITEPGWYRITAWEPVDYQTARNEIAAAEGQDLIYVKDPKPGSSYQSSE